MQRRTTVPAGQTVRVEGRPQEVPRDAEHIELTEGETFEVAGHEVTVASLGSWRQGQQFEKKVELVVLPPEQTEPAGPSEPAGQ